MMLPLRNELEGMQGMREAARNAACRRECGIPQAHAYMFVFDPIALFKLQHQFGPPQAKEPT